MSQVKCSSCGSNTDSGNACCPECAETHDAAIKAELQRYKDALKIVEDSLAAIEVNERGTTWAGQRATKTLKEIAAIQAAKEGGK